MIAPDGKLVRIVVFVAPALFIVLGVAHPFFAQTTVGTSSIVGRVSDPSGAVLIGAEVTITKVATGQVVRLTTNSFGAYNSGALVPGDYRVQVSEKGFSSAESVITLLIGNT